MRYRVFSLLIALAACAAGAVDVAAQQAEVVVPGPAWRERPLTQTEPRPGPWPAYARPWLERPDTHNLLREARWATASPGRTIAVRADRPLWHYTLIGMGVGAAVGAGVAVYMIAQASDDPIFDPVFAVSLPIGVGAVGGALVGGLLGNIAS